MEMKEKILEAKFHFSKIIEIITFLTLFKVILSETCCKFLVFNKRESKKQCAVAFHVWMRFYLFSGSRKMYSFTIFKSADIFTKGK